VSVAMRKSPPLMRSDVVDVVVRMHAAVAVCDFESVRLCFWDDAVWECPGNGPFGGRHVGWEAIRDDLLALPELLSGGTYLAELLDAATGDEYVVAVLHATAEYRGNSLDVTDCQLIRVVDGRIREIRSHVSDVAAVDAFWCWESVEHPPLAEVAAD